MIKLEVGVVLRNAREAKAYSLRELAERVGIEHSRLARMEQGTRPAPGLSEIRTLSDVLELDMVDMLVAAGTSREVMGHLLWSERLQSDRSKGGTESNLPEGSLLLEKNTYRVSVLRRDGALCTVSFGGTTLDLFDFGLRCELAITIPPEVVLVLRDRPAPDSCTAENVLPVWVKKIRHLGQVANTVLVGDGLELNALHTREAVDALGLSVGDRVVALVPATAIRTSPIDEAS